MYHQINRILYGLFFILLDLNIGIDILPDVVGLIMIVSATKKIQRDSDLLKWPIRAFTLAGLISFLMLFINPNEFHLMVTILSVIYQLCFTLALYRVLEYIASFDVVYSLDVIKAYVVISLSVAFVTTFYVFSHTAIFQTVLMIIGFLNFLLYIVLLFDIRKLRNQFYKEIKCS